MPAKPSWLLRIPEILQTLAAMQTPVIDRATCERLFLVRRRRAIELLQRFGGYMSGNTVLVDRVALIQRLQALKSDPDTVQEVARKQRLSDEIDRLQRQSSGAAVRIARPLASPRHGQWAVPEGVSLSSGSLMVEFADVGQLLSRLYALAEAIAADFAGFAGSLPQTIPQLPRPSASGTVAG
jgi:hypothetical protein